MAHRIAQNRVTMRSLATNWIFGSLQQDALWLLFPGPLFLFLICFIGPLSTVASILFFIAFAFLDSGHVYLTWWRTIFNPKERGRTSSYFIVPLLILLTFTTLFYFDFSYIWSLVLYATAFHYIKQVIGFYHLYRKGRARDKLQTILFSLLLFLPFCAFHFKPDLVSTGFYTQNDLLLFPSEKLYQTSLITLLLFHVSFIFWELRNYFLKRFCLPAVLYIFIMSWFYIVLFLTPQFSMPVILSSLILSHSIPYSRLIQKSLKKKQPLRWFQTNKNVILVVLLTLMVLGGFESSLEKYFIDFKNQHFSMAKSLFHGLYLVPLFFHFYFDGVIWKRNHPEFPHF